MTDESKTSMQSTVKKIPTALFLRAQSACNLQKVAIFRKTPGVATTVALCLRHLRRSLRRVPILDTLFAFKSVGFISKKGLIRKMGYLLSKCYVFCRISGIFLCLCENLKAYQYED